MIYRVAVLLLLTLSSACSTSSKVPLAKVTVTPGKYSDYYHLAYQLESGQYRINSGYGFNPGGQFEVFIDKQYFPIAAPNCNSHIIVRMPYSKNEAKKLALYQDLVNGQSRKVILELNPYVKVIDLANNKFELTYCNVFFRHKNGDYYDRL